MSRQQKAAYNETAIIPANAVKVPYNDANNGKWPNRGREEDTTSVSQYSICIIETDRPSSDMERNGQLIEMVNDLSGRGARQDTMDEYFRHTRFGGIALRNALDTTTAKDTIYGVAKAGSTSTPNTGSGPIRMGDDLEYGGPMHDNPMAFMDDPTHPKLTHSDNFCDLTEMAPGKTPIMCNVWRAEKAISAKNVFANGVKRGSAKNRMYNAETARDSAVIKAALTALARDGRITLHGDLSQGTPARRTAFEAAYTDNGEMNPAFTQLIQSIDDGLTTNGRKSWKSGGRSGNNEPLMEIIQRLKFSRTRDNTLFRKSKFRNPKQRTLALRQESAMGEYYAAVGRAYHNSRSRVFATAISSAERGELVDIVIKAV